MKVFQLFAPSVLFALLGCASGSPAPADSADSTQSAVADMLPVRGTKVRGMIRIRKTNEGLLFRGEVAPLPRGRYGFGIHEGDCSAHDGTSAGQYLGPADAKGQPLGVLYDLTSDASDKASVQRVETKFTLEQLLGKALVIQAWAYDATQDVKSVPFVACGVIRGE